MAPRKNQVSHNWQKAAAVLDGIAAPNPWVFDRTRMVAEEAMQLQQKEEAQKRKEAEKKRKRKAEMERRERERKSKCCWWCCCCKAEVYDDFPVEEEEEEPEPEDPEPGINEPVACIFVCVKDRFVV